MKPFKYHQRSKWDRVYGLVPGNSFGRWITGIILLAIFFYGCNLARQRPKATVQDVPDFTAQQMKFPQLVYARNCFFCHGAEMEGGSGPALYQLGKRVDLAEFKRIIGSGKGQMPGFSLLDEATVVNLYKYLSETGAVSDSSRQQRID